MLYPREHLVHYSYCTYLSKYKVSDSGRKRRGHLNGRMEG